MEETILFLLNNLIFIILLNILGFGLILWVYFANRREKINRLFFLMMTPIILWTNFNYIAYTTNSIVFKKLNLATVCIFFIFVYFFSIYFPRHSIKKHSILDKIIIFVWILFAILVIFTDFLIEDLRIENGIPNFIFGLGSYIFYPLVAFFTFFILFTLFQKYFTLSKEDKLKVQYFFVGTLLFAVFNLIFNVVLPLIWKIGKYYQLGDYSAFFLLGFTAYAIVKRELFGIKIVLTALLVGLIALLLLLDILFFTTQPLFQLLKAGILVIFLYVGYSLVKSVIREIKLREKLQNAYADLQVLDKAKSEFVSMASHQLRTPLSAIKGYISMILEGSYGPLPVKIKGKMKNVFQSNERLLGIVNDLLNISKVELGKVQVEKKPNQLEEVIQSCYEESRMEAKKRNLRFIWQKPKTPLPKIKIDSLKIRQVISNLIDNALRYTQKGEIRIQVQKIDSVIQISVKDTGRGLSEKEEKRIFEGFTRGAAGLAYWIEGTGLGLYVAKKYVELHQGKIWAESKGEDRGSAFFVELPING